MKIGVISDTHGLLRPAAIKALEDCEQIIHAGDLGDPKVLLQLKKIAPVTAVRGNVDQSSWADLIPMTEVCTFGKTQIYVRHILDDLDLDPAAAGFQMVITGHTHKPNLEEKNGVHYLNPGSAGPRRFKLPITLAILKIQDDQIAVEFVDLEKTEESLLEKLIHFDINEFISGE